MTNFDKYKNVFVSALKIDISLVEKMQYKDGLWDSVGHLSLITELEEVFGIEISPYDIMRFDSFQCGIEILKKYGIEI